MSGCNCGNVAPFTGDSQAYRRVLIIVIAVNATMFLVEATAGLLSGSMALRADALDFLGDSLTYALSLLAVGRPVRWRSRAALVKSVSLAAMGCWVLLETGWRVLVLGLPNETVMGTVGLLALAANAGSALLLSRWRDGDANVRSVWLCSRNDAIGNAGVVAAAAAVWWTATPWPDLVVAALMAGIFLSSSLQIAVQARREMGIACTQAGARSVS